MDCGTCGREGKDFVSRNTHEADLDRLDRINKRWFWAWLITFVLMIGCITGFAIYKSQWETVETREISQEVDTGEGDAYVAGGDLWYGES